MPLGALVPPFPSMPSPNPRYDRVHRSALLIAGVTEMSQQMVDLMEAVWRSIDGLCADLTPEQWALPTECPGWAVQDQVSHLVGSECRLLGRPAPDHEPADTSHVQNEVGQSNEVLVDYRRQFSGAEVLAEFREITAERLGVLRAMTEEDFAAETPNPLGSGPYTDLLAIRIYDAWVHEQDMRRTWASLGILTVRWRSTPTAALGRPCPSWWAARSGPTTARPWCSKSLVTWAEPSP